MDKTTKRGAVKMPALVLRWSREPSETGLRRVGQGERGWDLKAGGERVASVRPRYEGWGRIKSGYYWTARSDAYPIPTENTSSAPTKDVLAALSAVEAHVSAALAGRYRVSVVRPPSMPKPETA